MPKKGSNWIQRQKSDRYYLKSKKEGHRARSYYKLEQIDQKYRIINLKWRNPPKILDLGAAPGAWLEYISIQIEKKWEPEIIGKNQVIGIDLTTIKPFEGKNYISTHRMDIFKDECFQFVKESGPFDVILSDLAPKTAGDSRDIALQTAMVLKVKDYLEFLRPKGKLVCKVFQSEETYGLNKSLSKMFQQFYRMKPQASRQQSRELFFIGLGFKSSI